MKPVDELLKAEIANTASPDKPAKGKKAAKKKAAA
jgi:hypothetical protein